MKKIIVAILLLFPAIVFSQELNAGDAWRGERGKLFKSYAPFTATSDDTSGFVTIDIPGLVSDPLMCSEVRLLGVATDSISADVYVNGTNRKITSITASYSDSIIGTSNTLNIVVISIKANGLDRIPGCTEFKVGTVFRATGNGTTSGRTMKWYVMYKLR